MWSLFFCLGNGGFKLILDVGCGASPVGDVNCDLMLIDSDLSWNHTSDRGNNFVKATVLFLPFKSNCFRVVHCSHLLEHLDDPDAGLVELRRVSMRYVVVVLPFGLFSIFDILDWGKRFGDHMRWLKAHHKHFFLMDRLKAGSFKLCFVNLIDAVLFRKKSFHGLIRIPIPFETRTIIEVDHDA